MDVYLCDRFLCLSNPESWSAFAVVAAANSTQPVPTAADLKAPRLPEWLSGQVRTYAVLDGGCHTLEVFRMIKESESWILLAESFSSSSKSCVLVSAVKQFEMFNPHFPEWSKEPFPLNMLLSNCSTCLLACSASPKVKNEPRDQKHQWNPAILK